MRFRSIGVRLTLWYSGLLGCTFFVLAAIGYSLLSVSLAREMDSALEGVAEVLVRTVREDDRSFFPDDVDELFRRFFGFSPLDRRVELFDPLGRREDMQNRDEGSLEMPLSEAARQAAADGRPLFETLQSPAERYPIRVLTMPVLERGRLVHLVRVAMSLENSVAAKRRFLTVMAAIFPVALLLAGGGGWLVARRALRPVDKMTRAARKISAERLDRRLAESGSGDELDRLANTLNEMLGRLDESVSQMRRFSADASHELQTPLTIIKGEFEVALRRPRERPEYEAVLRSGLEEIDRLNHLVEGLLLLARADAGVLATDFQQTNVGVLAAKVVEQLTTMAATRRISLTLASAAPVVVLGDGEHLYRALMNLVDNGIKYTPEGGSVQIRIDDGADEVRIAVIDTGIGISTQEQERIFHRFHRSDQTRTKNAHGVGLGLSIVQSIAAAHGGRLEVKSEPGRGSTFCLILPKKV
jgi:two-component system OmpR family sensor kinase